MIEEDRFWKSRSKICPICGKNFIAMYPDLYTYRKGKKYFCSWTCYRKYLNKSHK